MSLKSILHSEIKRAGYLGLDEVETVTKNAGHKLSTAERTLRQSAKKEFVKPKKNEKGYIIGYQWIGEELDPNVYSKEAIKLKELQRQGTLI